MQLELFDNSVYVQSSTLYVRRLLALNHTRQSFPYCRRHKNHISHNSASNPTRVTVVNNIVFIQNRNDIQVKPPSIF